MKKNIGSADRIGRIVVGTALVVLGLIGVFGAGWPAWLAGVVGLVLVGTALAQTCPGYSILGIRTDGGREA
jgi:hypothetical protein